ncbi:MAG: hypothetical protein L6R38_005475 [Xanthoria sp. 2 TBL-2021]|nr:MAG: hypothetical protein L6R38_005475 [Xanthoria sp. 2 TBL-2021]
MADLAMCTPAVKHVSLQEARADYAPLPSEATKLLDKMKNIPFAVIPVELQNAYEEAADTPRKSRDPPNPYVYLSAQETPYPPECMQRIKERIDETVHDAKINFESNAHERQWGATASRLINELRQVPYKSKFQVLNTENCPIEPTELYTQMLDCPLVYEDDSKISKADNVVKMVDWSCVLDIDRKVKGTITNGFKYSRPNERSLNQSLSYIRLMPIFLDLEIKQTSSQRDPKVQIAVWASAGYMKRIHHGWDPSLPIPAITISGHQWQFYLFFYSTTNKELVMIGPYEMGTTSSVEGTWQIVHQLDVLLRWGTTVFSDWFDKNVVAWAQKQSHSPGEQQVA